MSASEERSEGGKQTCSACRGRGHVISNLGGEAHDVTCPWCEGTGEFQAGHDAQEHVAEGPGPSAPGRPAPETGV